MAAKNFIEEMRQELKDKEATIKKELSEETATIGSSLATGLKTVAIVGGSLALSYAAYRLLAAEEGKKFKKIKRKGEGLKAALASFATKHAIDYVSNLAKNVSTKDSK